MMKNTSSKQLIALGFVAIVGALVPIFGAPFATSVAALGLVYAIYATSVGFLAGQGGMFTLGQAGTFATAAYTVAILSNQGFGVLTQVAAALLVALVLALVFGLLAVRATGVYFIMITLAEGMVVWGASFSLARWTGGENGIPGVSRPSWLGNATVYYYLLLGALIAVLFVVRVIQHSTFGLALRSTKANLERSRAIGFNVFLIRLIAFMMSGVLAGFSGVLYVYLQRFIGPGSAYITLSIIGMLMVLVGGINNLYGPLVGAIITVFVQNVVNAYVDRWPTILGGIFIVVVIFARDGVMGLAKKGGERLKKISP